MKKKIILSLIIIMLLCFTSCKKKESEKLEFLEKPLESYVVNTSTNQALENIKIKITNREAICSLPYFLFIGDFITLCFT